MPFATLSPDLAAVAQCALTHCRAQYGAAGLKTEEGIDASISWRPTFYFKKKKFEIFSAEVSDLIFPEVIKSAALDILHYKGLIRVYQVIPLEIYQADKDQKRINLLRSHGFGAMTVSSTGGVVMQFDCVPLLQFITISEFDEAIKGLPAAIRVRLREAYNTYLANTTQGVQDAGQILEGLIQSIAKQSAAAANLSNAAIKGTAANLIDTMYNNPYFKDHRATLGAVRHFMTVHRNPTSHAPKSAKEAAERVRNLREGFIAALRQTTALAKTANVLGLRAIVHG